ncbi:MAG: septal ring lytic transglycosylase RlpA family protein [Cyanobacteria bacterium HKST-UBA06]|nr:septal ring lytic transglycosylase RlpA family protein [Cyanobacteria bacterium HKST-UBA05]MCA9800172.1 septal ring lytic transglycosylase RlpA family protein [Cyanobacteria bacterium HKST-UBA04]MCA9807090.1 septal ring lytic transglycosylase RlpA family protein [Cyanobacteria bacterium HKST-UBA06]MCA9840717.1 septal ring lytic transglycosylase RlpA family protein [Cyanobacteria bacterium HKST-UBA03]
MGKGVLLTIAPQTAENRKLSSNELALEWANNIRQALGEAPVTQEDALALLTPALPPGVKGRLPNYEKIRHGIACGRIKMHGQASWYGPGFHGRRTANGERFDMDSLTAAHRTLPFNTRVKVTNVRNGKSVVVRINDRGPYAHGRVIDLSKGAAREIGLISSGTATIHLEVVE